MGIQLLFVVETNEQSKSDYIYQECIRYGIQLSYS